MFGTAAITPGFANRRQKGTLPSAKSNQYGALPGSVHWCRSAGGVGGTGSALASVVPTRSAAATASRTPALLTAKTVARRPGEPGLRSQTVYDSESRGESTSGTSSASPASWEVGASAP